MYKKKNVVESADTEGADTSSFLPPLPSRFPIRLSNEYSFTLSWNLSNHCFLSKWLECTPQHTCRGKTVTRCVGRLTNKCPIAAHQLHQIPCGISELSHENSSKLSDCVEYNLRSVIHPVQKAWFTHLGSFGAVLTPGGGPWWRKQTLDVGFCAYLEQSRGRYQFGALRDDKVAS